MAKLEFIDHGIRLETYDAIKHFLETEGIQFGLFSLNTQARSFAKRSRLSDEERQDLLHSYREVACQYNNEPNFRQDVIFLHPGFEHYAFLVNKFGALHYHYENEYWYMLGGTGRFGYLGLQGLRFMLHLEPGEFVSVPEGRWQWWASNIEEEFKAMRFFNSQNQLIIPDLNAICHEALQQQAATRCSSSEIDKQ